jgi:FkbM family methyltransferase
MFQNAVRKLAVSLFGVVARLGISSPRFDRVFLALYNAYKLHVEAGPIDRLKELVPEGSIVIDVGANVGFFSRRFAAWVGEKGKAILIEPEDRNYEILISALRREHLLDRTRALKAVVAAAPGRAFLEINPLHPAHHKLSKDNTGVAVEAVTLDSLVSDKGDRKLSLVKIDVQGAEMLVLQGASEILRMSQPALFIELHEEGLNKFGTSVPEILNYLANYGYEPHLLARKGPCIKIGTAEIHARIAQGSYIDVLFLARS